MTITRPRTTVPLTGTTFRTSAQLDHRATVALSWARAWLAASGPLQVPASGVIRRALQVYVDHLAQVRPADQAAEFAAVLRACKATTPDDDNRRAACERLQTNPRGTFPAPLLEVLYGPGWADWLAAPEDTAGTPTNLAPEASGALG